MALGPLGAPLAGLYGALVLARRAAYDRGWLRTVPSPLYTISVGGLEAGGSGKTPVTGLLLGALAASGRAVGLLTRGYGRTSRGLVLRSPGEPAAPEMVGDEPAMLVSAGPDVPVAACAARVEGARALARIGCDCAVLDDAFSHRAIARDVDLVVLRGEAPLGNGHLLPWGSLREPASSLARADVVWLHFRGRAAPAPSWLDAPVVVVSESVPGPLRDAHSGEVVEPRGPLLAAAGIARPSDLVVSLRALGAEVARLVSFRDHHRFDAADVDRLVRAGRAHGAVVVTAKDAVKIAPLWRPAQPPLWVLEQRVAIRRGLAALAETVGIQEEFLRGGSF